MYETGKGLLRKAPNSKARAEAAVNDAIMFHDDRSQDGDEVDDDYMHGSPYHHPHHAYSPTLPSPSHHSRSLSGSSNSLSILRSEPRPRAQLNMMSLNLPPPNPFGPNTLPSPNFLVSPPMSSPASSPHVSRETQDHFPFGPGRSDANTVIRDQRSYPTPTSDVFPGNVNQPISPGTQSSAQSRSEADQKAVGSFRVSL